MTGFEPHFSSGLVDGKEYLLEGMIVEDRLCYGAFWVYASRLTRAEQDGADQPATLPESQRKSDVNAEVDLEVRPEQRVAGR